VWGLERRAGAAILDSRLRGNDEEFPDCTVIPAQAGIQNLEDNAAMPAQHGIKNIAAKAAPTGRCGAWSGALELRF